VSVFPVLSACGQRTKCPYKLDTSPTERTVDNFVIRLRKLFETDPKKPRHFPTVRGEGYRFVP